ncbi:MAG: enoyl-CoA hydratase/isomerase family protein [Planctomycetes bacterium]|nr:enoyl-CoA hydratase/isomerase family protein [Planctomycetota bacterium]
MSDLQHIKYSITNGVARLFFNRPPVNVLNIAMMKEINSVLEPLVKDNSVKLLLITGEGNAFCAGVDVGEHSPDKVSGMISSFHGMFRLLESLEIPVVVSVNGSALGGGMEVALAGDIVIASNQAKFGQPEIKLGFFPPIAAVLLQRHMDWGRAFEICVTGRTYGAAEMKEFGLVGRVVEPDKLQVETDAVVAELAQNSIPVMKLAKKTLKAVWGRPFEGALGEAEGNFLNKLMKLADVQEGIRSFAEKRRPEWKNS